MPIAWNQDPPGSEAQIAANAAAVLGDIAADAPARTVPTLAMAQEWHRRLYDGVQVPVHYYAGEFRDSDTSYPELYGYEVQVGPFPGVPSADVPQSLAHFEQQVQAAVAQLDAAIPPGAVPQPSEIGSVLVLCANVHGEWIRIHPFANGNGRTARLWANWAALRYELPPFVTIKPRPGNPYGAAAMQSMTGNHQAMVAAFVQMLRAHLR